VALREAKTLLGVFGRRGASILVRPALCLGRPFGPAAALGSGLLMSMLFYTIRRDRKQPTTCLYVLTTNSLQQQQGPLVRQSGEEAPHAPSSGSCAIRVPRSFPSCCLPDHGILPYFFDQAVYLGIVNVALSSRHNVCVNPSHGRIRSANEAPQDSCKPNRNLATQPHLDSQAGLSQPCCGPVYIPYLQS
jgi:hypothetical protein